MSSPAIAEELIALADSLPTQDARAPALLAIAILENHLYSRREHPLPPSVSLSLELRIAQVLFRHTGQIATVESMLATLSSKIGNYEEFIPLRIEANALLAQLMQQSGQIRAAVKVLEHSANLAAERHLCHLQYSALLQSYQMMPNPALLRSMTGLAQERGHLDVSRLLSIVSRIERTRQGMPNESSASITEQPPTLLDLMQLVKQIISDVTNGEIASTLPKLSTLHAQLDSLPWPTSQIIHINAGQSLTLTWLSKAQGFALVSLLSAQVHLADLVSHRAARFLQDGLQQLPHIRDVAWRDRIHAALLTTQAMDAIMRQQFPQASILLGQVSQLAAVPLLRYLKASLLQAQGQLAEALQEFLSLANGLQSLHGRTPTADKAIPLISGLSAVLILRSNTQPALCNPSEAASLLSTLRPHCTGPLKALSELVSAADHQRQQEHPLEVRKMLTGLIGQAARLCHTDLKMLSLALLASPRNLTDPPEAKRQFAQAAYGLATRQPQEVSLWSLWNGKQFASALEAGGAVEQAGQQHVTNQRIRGILQERGQLGAVPWL